MKFKRSLDWAYNSSPFYRENYKDAGLEPGDIKTFDDLKNIPKIEKGMMRDTQQEELEGLDVTEHGGMAYPDFEVSAYTQK